MYVIMQSVIEFTAKNEKQTYFIDYDCACMSSGMCQNKFPFPSVQQNDPFHSISVHDMFVIHSRSGHILFNLRSKSMHISVFFEFFFSCLRSAFAHGSL